MLQGKYSRKMVAATLLTILMTNTFAPTVALALTSGPTQPEATSFEPVDTTDMVNQQTGDFTYNLPLLEVPGPEGGYPLSLAYHAGIMTNQDASWVGLGWTLNPGEINRNVNGYPDDWQMPQSSNRVYWSGGTTTSYNVGVSIGIANTPATVNFGLTFANDTYRGFGVGVEEGVGAHFNIGHLSLNAGVSAGVGPYGSSIESAGVGANLSDGKTMGSSLGVSASTNFKALSAGVSGSIGEGSSRLGVSMKTDGTSSFKIGNGGFSASSSNSNASKVSTSSNGFNVEIPIYAVNLSLGYSKVRYWTDETQSVTTRGSIYSSGTESSGAGPDNIAYDEYSLLEDPGYKNSVLYPDPTIVQGGAYPDYDVYNVNAQGLSGSMRPYLYQGSLLNQNIKSGTTPLVTYYNSGGSNAHPRFRFEGDFSNSYRQATTAFDPSLDPLSTTPPLDNTPVYGSTDPNSPGYGSPADNTGNASFALAGSRYVDPVLRVHPRNALGYNRADKLIDPGMIEGYSITNESGMSYHFGLPAYSFNEQNYQEKIAHNSDGTVNSFNRVTRSTPYAYTWYLTTVTGPDFVDRNDNGIADDGDWGYWVNFEYGKWSSQFNWRNPSEGFQRDEDNHFQDVSMGTKEVYYLNAIRTRTHVALFEKAIRYDGKGESQSQFTTNYSNGSNTDYFSQGLFDATSSASLQLSRIYLLNAADEGFVNPASDTYGLLYNYACAGCVIPGDVLDSYDVSTVGRANLEAKAIRVIDFNYDYSLCQGTSNSYDYANPAVKYGKLTLTSVVSRGKGGTNLLPATQFSYDLTGADANAQTGVILTSSNFSTTNSSFQIGDLIMASGSPAIFCGVISGTPAVAGGVYTYPLKNSNYTGGSTTANIYTTKNPPYKKDAYDNWQLFKSDLDLTVKAINENAARTTTPVSAASADAWSLKTVTSALGAQFKIGLESDKIIKSVYNVSYPYYVTNLTLVGTGLNQVSFTPNILSPSMQVGDQGNIIIQTQYDSPQPSGTNPGLLGQGEYSNYYVYKSTYTVSQVSGGTIYVNLASPIPASLPGNDNSIYNFTRLFTANVSTPNASGIYGGGIRTSKISLVSADGTQNITSYNYNNPSTNLTSGVTSYLPSISEEFDTAAFTANLDSYLAGVISNQQYKPALNNDLNYLYSISRELPPPQVIYEYVTVTNQVKDPDESAARTLVGSTMYQFEVFRNNMVGRNDVTTRPALSTVSGGINRRNMTLQKFIGSIGNLKRTVKYDNNGKMLSTTINHYLHDNLIGESLINFMTDYKALLSQPPYNYQGYLQERYAEVKKVQNQPSSRPQDNATLATLCAREEFPCIQTGQTQINYVNGTQTSTQNLGFDFFSGALTQSLETDAYGNNFLTETVPAYREYPAMGLKVSAQFNKNMLTQVAETRTWTVNASNTATKIGLVSATVNTWSDLIPALGIDGSVNTQNDSYFYGRTDVWRPQFTYSWMPTNQTTDGLTPASSFAEFNWTTPSSADARWVKTSEATLYDVYSKPLEEKDMNGNYAAVHLNYGDQKVALTGSMTGYYEIAYSGAEDQNLSQTNQGFIQASGGTVSTTVGTTHTGAKSLLLNAGGTKGFVYSVPTNNLTSGRTYTASVWVKPVSGTASDVKIYYDINGGTAKPSVSSSLSGKIAGGWTLVNLTIAGTDITAGQTLNVWCRNDHTTVGAYVDDMRFQPQNISTIAYVYDPISGELTHILDNSNLYTRFEYDAAGRLAKAYKEKLNTATFTSGEFKTNQYQYNYSAPKFTSAAINNISFVRNSCPLNLGYTGSSVAVTIPAGAYSSFMSQSDADGQAQAYAQDYANQHGTCSCASTFTFATGINSRTYSLTPSGTQVGFTFGFVYPTGASSFFTLGKLNSCVLPAATRTIPITITTGVFNVIISPDGTVSLQLVSGSAPTGGVTFIGVYDLQVNLFYSDAESGTYTKSCPSGQVGSSYTYTVPAYKYYSTTSVQAADNLAVADVQANGQNAANASGICSIPCTFSWASIITDPYSYTLAQATSTTESFTFEFEAPTSSYSSGTIGTITGGCLPSVTRVVSVTEGNNTNRIWNVTFSTTGSVSVTLTSGSPATNLQHPIKISGTYSL